MKDRKIAWERWADEILEDDNVDMLEDIDDDEENNDEIMRIEGMIAMPMPMTIRTPLGEYSPVESMSPSNMFDCWICHTNFDITEADKSALDLVEGVEALKIMSRYRFFIGIGKMFSLTEVRPLVEIALGVNKYNVISQLISEISGKKRWAIGIYGDGTCKSITSDSDSDEAYNSKLVDMRISGVINILTSDEV